MNGESQNSAGNNLALSLNSAGRYQLVVMDDVGQMAVVNFTLQ